MSVVLCYVVLCCVMLCYVVLCCVVLCCVVLCCVVLTLSCIVKLANRNPQLCPGVRNECNNESQSFVETPSKSETKSSRSGIRHMEYPTQGTPTSRQSPKRKRGKRQQTNRQTTRQTDTNRQTNRQRQSRQDPWQPTADRRVSRGRGRGVPPDTMSPTEPPERSHRRGGPGCGQSRSSLDWVRLSQKF